MVDYEDGTPASAPQMARDVVTFLAWAGDRRLDDRKEMALKIVPVLAIGLFTTFYAYRFLSTYYKTAAYRWIPRIRDPKK